MRLRTQDFGLPKGTTMKSIPHIAAENAASISFGSQIRTINASLAVIAKQGASNVATGIEELIDAVGKSAELKEHEKSEVLAVIAEIAKQAEAKPEARSKGIVKALMAGFPAVIGKASDLMRAWDKCGPTLKGYFGS